METESTGLGGECKDTRQTGTGWEMRCGCHGDGVDVTLSKQVELLGRNPQLLLGF